MPRIAQAYGIGQALIPVLPPPIALESAPTSSQTNYSIGQVVFTPPNNPTAFYLYAGDGTWVEFDTNSGAVLSVTGTANQVTATTTAGNVVLTTPSTFIAPGSIASTTTVTSGTGFTATLGNLTLSGAGSKLVIHASTAASDSVGVSAALDGASPSQLVVSTTAVTGSSKIFLSYATAGGTQGSLSVGTIVANTSFQIKSSANGDTSTVNYLIIN